jgi:hypothetical protein
MAVAATILSEHYSVIGQGYSYGYSDNSNIPPLSGYADGCSSTADYFRVYAVADYDYEGHYSYSQAYSDYEIVPSDEYLRIKVKNTLGSFAYGWGGFSLFDQTDGVSIEDFKEWPWNAGQEYIKFFPVDINHQYKFTLKAGADSAMLFTFSEIQLTGEISSVPEPSVFLLLALGSAILRKRKAKI